MRSPGKDAGKRVAGSGTLELEPTGVRLHALLSGCCRGLRGLPTRRSGPAKIAFRAAGAVRSCAFDHTSIPARTIPLGIVNREFRIGNSAADRVLGDFINSTFGQPAPVKNEPSVARMPNALCSALGRITPG